MAGTKPPCEEFIIPCIRKVRRDMSRIKSGAAPGVALWKVENVVKTIYGVQDFTSAINALITAEKVLLVAEHDVILVKDGGQIENEKGAKYKNIHALPVGFSYGRGHVWYVDASYKLRERTQLERRCSYDRYCGLQLHVIEDGLADRVKRAVGYNEATAYEIIASLQKNDVKKK